MKNRLTALLLLLALLCSCSMSELKPQGFGTREMRQAERETNAALEAQLGLLSSYITTSERAAVQDIWETLSPIRQARLEAGDYSRGEYEWRLLRRLNKLYEEYTIKYLDGDDGGFGYTYPSERMLAEFIIADAGALEPGRGGIRVEGTEWEEQDLYNLWDMMLDLLPDGAFRDFSRFTVFSDGEGETMAYVQYLDSKGTRWEIALDPADSDDGVLFTETVLHEYFHYLTLNNTQVVYTKHQTVDTYNEAGMVTNPGSYLDDFYQQFWTDYLDDRLTNLDSYNFFLRHDDDFIGPYASTDPSEDIAESFAYFVLRERAPGNQVWQQKLNFFYDYPELVEFRTQVRENLGLEGEKAA